MRIGDAVRPGLVEDVVLAHEERCGQLRDSKQRRWVPELGIAYLELACPGPIWNKPKMARKVCSVSCVRVYKDSAAGLLRKSPGKSQREETR